MNHFDILMNLMSNRQSKHKYPEPKIIEMIEISKDIWIRADEDSKTVGGKEQIKD